jgi:hypothetical protein
MWALPDPPGLRGEGTQRGRSRELPCACGGSCFIPSSAPISSTGYPRLEAWGEEREWLVKATPEVPRKGPSHAHPKGAFPLDKVEFRRLSEACFVPIPGLVCCLAFERCEPEEGSTRRSVLNLYSTQPGPFGDGLVSHRLGLEATTPRLQGYFSTSLASAAAISALASPSSRKPSVTALWEAASTAAT